METPSQALERLRRAGYTADFQAVALGLRNEATGKVYRPETLKVEEAVRFEGESDPGDEAIVFALAPADGGQRGTYAVAYGLAMAALDAEIVPRLGTGWPKPQGTPIGATKEPSRRIDEDGR